MKEGVSGFIAFHPVPSDFGFFSFQDCNTALLSPFLIKIRYLFLKHYFTLGIEFNWIPFGVLRFLAAPFFLQTLKKQIVHLRDTIDNPILILFFNFIMTFNHFFSLHLSYLPLFGLYYVYD